MGKGLKELGKELHKDGISSPTGKGWGKTTLYHMLTNEAYTGTLIWGRNSLNKKCKPVRVENAWPAIVEREVFHRVQRLLKERAPAQCHPRRTSSKYLLSGLAHCGRCGKALIGQDAKCGKFSYYVCGTLLKKGAGTCDAHYLNAEKFDGLVIDKVKQRILTEDNLHQLVTMVNEELDAFLSEYRKRLDAIDTELVDVARRLERLYDTLETGKLELSDLAPRIRLLRQRQDQLQLAKEELQDKSGDRKVEVADLQLVRKYAEDLRNVLSRSSLAERKAFIRSFVKEVKVTNKDVELFYTIPLPPRGIIQDKAEVLSIVQLGSGGWIRS